MGLAAVLPILFLATLVCAAAASTPQDDPGAPPRLRIEPGHPWTPPFGLERVGRPLDAVVELPDGPAGGTEYVVVGYRGGAEVSRQPVSFARTGNMARVALDAWPEEAALWVRAEGEDEGVEVARATVEPPSLEAEVRARPDASTHPVDLGTIFVPADWLLLANGQGATVDVAALSRADVPVEARVVAWYESAPERKTEAALPLQPAAKAQVTIELGPPADAGPNDSLHVRIVGADGPTLWEKAIPVMLVAEAPAWPEFGAVETKLRYDAPIPVNGGEPISYEDGWAPELQDVVVTFPNGARFVFWRGASYCPLWAGSENTGLCYEWAEILTGDHMVGRRDCVEPLQDKELRYGSVTVVESTPARAHVRWDYESCDMDYRVWGEYASEDFYFYPDGFGMRVMSLTAHPGIEVETNEFIIFTPQAGYPFECLPEDLIEVLWQGGKAAFRFPCFADEQPEAWAQLAARPSDVPALYRIRIDRSGSLCAIHYSPLGSAPDLPGFAPFCDQGAVVTPMYWGHHWPLSRGYPTGFAISDRIGETPGHSSSIHDGNPRPVRTETIQGDDGETLERRTWVWLIGMTDADDEELRQWAESVSRPPVVRARGATAGDEPYVIERRALCLTVQDRRVELVLEPQGWCVNPVLELEGAPERLMTVRMEGQTLDPDRYRWDGAALWLDARFDGPTTFELEFGE